MICLRVLRQESPCHVEIHDFKLMGISLAIVHVQAEDMTQY
jgi:hypothetical protein